MSQIVPVMKTTKLLCFLTSPLLYLKYFSANVKCVCVLSECEEKRVCGQSSAAVAAAGLGAETGGLMDRISISEMRRENDQVSLS